MAKHRIAVIPGDGIGREVIAAGVEVLRALESRFPDLRLETEAFALFRSTGRPILGVCRGLHAINVLMGGTLVGNLAEITQTEHVARDHEVALAGPLAALAGSDQLTVNSFHNQGISAGGVADELTVFAEAGGGIVEGLYHPREPILGIQWHPEREDPAARFDTELLRTFLTRGAFWHGAEAG